MRKDNVKDEQSQEEAYTEVSNRVMTVYAISPAIVKLFGNTDWFKSIWKKRLDKMVSNLRSSGVEDTPYEDKNW